MTDDRLIDFAGLLRQNGVRVSPGELATAAEALALVPFEDRESVRAALRATMVKRGADAPVFDRLFELYFGAMGRLLEGLEETLANGLKMDDLSLEEMQEVAKVLSELGASGGLAHSLVQGQLGSIAKLMRAAALKVEFSGLKSPLQKGFFARRVGTAAGLSEVSREFRLLEQALADKGIDPALVERVSRRLDDAIDALQETARRVTDLEYEARDAAAAEPGAVTKKSITSLTPAELQRMRDVVKRLAEKLKSRIARRRRERRRGQLNVRRTLRRNMSLGGVPARLSFRSRRPARPEIVVLCDVSDSVRNVSRLMLQFVHTLQSLYARVRSFVFVSDVGEVTALFKNASVDDAVDGAVAGKVINLAAHSNYGHALRLFHKDFKGAVTRRTTLVVIGDGRSNHNPANAWVLEDLRRQARRVVWICPEERAAWGFGDSEMPSFARHCDRVFPVQTVEDLARAADELMP